MSILGNEDPSSSKKWEISCQKANLDYTVIDLTASDWYESIINSNSELFLLRPPGETFKFKQVYDERVFIISEVLKFFWDLDCGFLLDWICSFTLDLDIYFLM